MHALMTFSKSDLPSLDSIRNLLLLRFLAFFCFGSDFLYEPIRLFVTHTLGGKIFFNFVPQIFHVRPSIPTVCSIILANLGADRRTPSFTYSIFFLLRCLLLVIRISLLGFL